MESAVSGREPAMISPLAAHHTFAQWAKRSDDKEITGQMSTSRQLNVQIDPSPDPTLQPHYNDIGVSHTLHRIAMHVFNSAQLNYK